MQELSVSGIAVVLPLEVFKGSPGSTVKIFTSPFSDCSYRGLSVGSRHLFYGYDNGDDVVEVGGCGNTRKIAMAACHLRVLRERAWWWRSPFSRVRMAKWLRLRFRHCDVPVSLRKRASTT